MLILGIETSCDETGAAIYDDTRGLLAHALHSQVDLHDPYGGVVPELASRDHVRRLLPLVRSVLHQSGAKEADLGAVAYTQGPGLAGALLVGAAFAPPVAGPPAPPPLARLPRAAPAASRPVALAAVRPARLPQPVSLLVRC